VTRFIWAMPLLVLALFAGCSADTNTKPTPDAAQTPKSEDGADLLALANSVTTDMADPTEQAPVSWGAALESDSLAVGDTVLLVVRAKILDDWHIYAAKGETGVGTPTKLNLTLPEGIIQVGEWALPIAKVKESALGRISHHKSLATFALILKVNEAPAEDSNIVCDVDFQSCTDTGCLAPTSQQLTIPVSVTN